MQYEKGRREGQEGRTEGRTDWSARARTISARARSLSVHAHSRAQARSPTHTCAKVLPIASPRRPLDDRQGGGKEKHGGRG